MLKRPPEPPSSVALFAHLGWQALTSPRRVLRALFRRLRATESPSNPPSAWSEWDRDTSTRIGSLAFDPPAEPTVSIVIPFHDQIPATLACLESIAERNSATRFEVIAVDDASSDPRAALLDRVLGIRVLRTETRSGFIDSCNRGARAAKGRLLLVLNNDTLVTNGWLDALVRTFDDFTDVGLVGAKLICPDGRLQEAGGIVWRDGSAWNYGRGGAADAPEVSYAREVDYCSGACLMVPAALFDELGGFDTLYGPAYYEDTDLAFKVRQRGRRVMYQAACEVVHAEGATAGRRRFSGVKRHQLVNQLRFYRRWQAELRAHRPNGRQPERAKERNVRSRALILCQRVFDPGGDRGAAHLWSMVQKLADSGAKVTLLPEALDVAPSESLRLRSLGVEVLHRPFVPSVRRHLEERGEEIDLVVFESDDLATRLRDDVHQYCGRAEVLVDTPNDADTRHRFRSPERAK